jgi:hypothetical protein
VTRSDAFLLNPRHPCQALFNPYPETCDLSWDRESFARSLSVQMKYWEIMAGNLSKSGSVVGLLLSN